jgi:hypothetical protein
VFCQVRERLPKPDWGDVGICAARGGIDAGVDAEEDGGTITTGDRSVLCCDGCDRACDWNDLVDVRCGALATARAGAEECDGAAVVCVVDE